MMKYLATVVRAAGFLAMGLLLLLVLLQFSVVLLRYVFGVNFLWAQETAIAAHGAIFMLAAAWTLVEKKHVAIDVFSSRWPTRKRDALSKFGFIVFLLPMMIAIVVSSASYVMESWSILEGSQEVSGLPGRFLLKSLIPVFAVLMIAAGVSVFLSALRPRNENLS